MNQQQVENFYALALAVRRLFHKLGHGIGALHADTDVSAGMRAVLESVVDGGPQTVPHMARVRPVTRQHIQGLVNALIEGGYVEYVDNPAHQRSRLVSPTALGREVFREMRAVENEAFERLRVGISTDELAAATGVVKTLIEAFDGSTWRSIVEEHRSKSRE